MPRTFSEKTCINPNCRRTFFPTHGTQVYCERQCAINFNNDKKRHENNTIYVMEKQLRLNDKLLARVFHSDHYTNDQISEAFLINEGLILTIGSFEENLDTKRPIRWFHAYGLELISQNARTFTIHYRTNKLSK